MFVGFPWAAVGAWAGWSMRSFLVIGACLDAGGAWEYGGPYCYGAAKIGKCIIILERPEPPHHKPISSYDACQCLALALW